MKNKLLWDAVAALFFLAAIYVFIKVVMRSGDCVPWIMWAAIVAVITFLAMLVASVWWYDRWRGKR